MRWWKILGWSLTALVAREAYLALGPRRWARQEGYARAQRLAASTGKPLIVIGAPRRGFINVAVADYGCGDLCIDLEGCAGCERAVTGRAEDVLPFLPDDSAVVFVSCTLEYVDDVELVWSELQRIAGRELVVVTVEPWSLTAYFFPGAQRRILSGAQAGGTLRYRPLPWTRTTRALPATSTTRTT